MSCCDSLGNFSEYQHLPQIDGQTFHSCGLQPPQILPECFCCTDSAKCVARKRRCTLRSLGQSPTAVSKSSIIKGHQGVASSIWVRRDMPAGVLGIHGRHEKAVFPRCFFSFFWDFRSMFRHDYLHFLSDFFGCHRGLSAICAILTFGKSEHLAEHEKLMRESCISI